MKVNSQCDKNDKNFSVNKTKVIQQQLGLLSQRDHKISTWKFISQGNSFTKLIHGAASPGTEIKG